MTNTDTTAALVRLDHEGHHALLAPASAQGRFVVVLSSSVTGEIVRRSVRGRMPAFAVAVRLLRERAAAFFERAFSQASAEQPALFEGVAVDGGGALDAIAVRRNIVGGEIARYLGGLERLLEIEVALVGETMGERKAAIIKDGLRELRAQARPNS